MLEPTSEEVDSRAKSMTVIKEVVHSIWPQAEVGKASGWWGAICEVERFTIWRPRLSVSRVKLRVSEIIINLEAWP